MSKRKKKKEKERLKEYFTTFKAKVMSIKVYSPEDASKIIMPRFKISEEEDDVVNKIFEAYENDGTLLMAMMIKEEKK